MRLDDALRIARRDNLGLYRTEWIPGRWTTPGEIDEARVPLSEDGWELVPVYMAHKLRKAMIVRTAVPDELPEEANIREWKIVISRMEQASSELRRAIGVPEGP